MRRVDGENLSYMTESRSITSQPEHLPSEKCTLATGNGPVRGAVPLDLPQGVVYV